MTPETVPARFIPFRKRDIIDMCLCDTEPGDAQAQAFRRFAEILQSVFHHEFHAILEQLKDAYAPINPDADTRVVQQPAPGEVNRFFELLETVLDRANYEKLSDADLQQALKEESLFRIRLQVDFSDFAEVLLFCRGHSVRSETLVSWMGLRRRRIEFTNYDRVVVYLKFREDLEPSGDVTGVTRPGSTMLKLFQNVPRADLEMLFPNTRVRMRTLDKIMIGVPAVVSGGIVVTTKLGTTLVLIGSLVGYWIGAHHQPVELNRATVIALLAGLAALGGYLWKQVSNFRNRRLRFMQTLTRNLYFKNLDNNAGVFFRLVNDAEDEECKESLLAYHFLLNAEKSLAPAELDALIEQWFETRWNVRLDFEIEDALRKLERLKLVEIQAGRYSAVGLDEALRRLESRWDAFFSV